MSERSPTEHRAAVDVWRTSAAKHDHQIFGRKIETKKARHRDLAHLGALISFRNRPVGVAEGVPAEDPAPIQTNWSLVPANDNEPLEDGFGNERAVEYEPSLDLIEHEITNLQMGYRAEPNILTTADNGDRLAAREVHGVLYSDAVEYGWHVDDAGKKHKTIIRIGRLKFSDGKQSERGHKLVMDQVVEADIRMPVGAMLGEREKSARDKGDEGDATGSNSHYRWMVKAKGARRPSKYWISSPDVIVLPDGRPVAPADFIDQVRQAARDGYFTFNSEVENFTHCFPASVHQADGACIATLCLVAPREAGLRNRENNLNHLLKAANEISEKLGYRREEPAVSLAG